MSSLCKCGHYQTVHISAPSFPVCMFCTKNVNHEFELDNLSLIENLADKKGLVKKRKKAKKDKPWHWPFQRYSNGPEYSCFHGIGHSSGIHGCDNCCKDPNFPDNLKDIEGYSGRYKISSDGNVYSFKGKNRLLMAVHEKQGYLWVQLQSPRSYNAVHRLVAQAFIPNPENKRTVNHKDFDTFNNSVNNLEWMTDSENIQYSYDHGHRYKFKKEFGERNKEKAKIKDPSQALALFEQGLTYAEIAEQLNVHRETVGRAIRRFKKQFPT